MFKDYYKILEININASDDEIKHAYKRLAKKWHPDLNQNIDTTQQMQDINEAKLILLDKEAREKYDIEYKSFYEYVNKKEKANFDNQSETYNQDNYTKSSYERYQKEYEIKDDILKKWMNNAQEQAIEIVKQALRDVKGVSVAASKGCLTGITNAIIFIIAMFILGLIISLFR
ncbi:J domain-containing protein [Faecalibacter bovis]|uniref:DnaJ domain-containing protein n=1 Tax=Faecalibacter bovis TaxID=2898187 RepID=A0ABX7XAP7_9FLAO|nr:DnaJ domain-containing protein [Faecalibacter bovis]QTV04854.1 DnaJ domain-containing protein [Faecalibacter bovis]